jgi:SAM-dependent methyltransferase
MEARSIAPSGRTLSAEFSDPRLAAIFDTVNSIEGYKGFYLDLAAELAPQSILDVGCGTGRLTCELARKGFQLIGLDPSPALLDQARRRPGCENVRWVDGYLDQLTDARADLAIMTGHVAQFFVEDEDWRRALKATRFALNPGGHVAFETRNPLIPPFEEWPNGDAPRMVVDPSAGPVAWWLKLLGAEDRRVQYEIHYRFESTGEEVTATDELIFRPQEEIAQLLKDAGFSIDRLYGDWDRTAIGPKSPEMIFIARRI